MGPTAFPAGSRFAVLLTLAVLAAAVLGLACSTGPTSVGIPSSDANLTVRATSEFGEMAVTGFLQVQAPGVEVDTAFEIDLDEDGRPDAVGRVGWEVAVPYEFAGPGFHVLSTTLDGPDGRRSVRDTVVVSDPSALRLVSLHDLPSSPSNIEFDPVRDRLYIDYPNEGRVRAHDAETLEEVWSVEVPGFSRNTGIALDPQSTTLYLGIGGLRAIDLEPPQPTARLLVDASWFNVVSTTPQGDVLASVSHGIIRYDRVAGEVAVVREPDAAPLYGFAVSPDGLEVAALTKHPANGVSFLDTATLSSRLDVPLETQPVAAAWSLDGARLYVLAQGCRFNVLDTQTGASLAERVWTGSCGGGFPYDRPATHLPGGRWIVFMTGFGAIIVDGSTYWPRFHVGDDPDGLPLCCSVAVDPVRGLLHFVDSSRPRLITMEFVP